VKKLFKKEWRVFALDECDVSGKYFRDFYVLAFELKSQLLHQQWFSDTFPTPNLMYVLSSVGHLT